MQREEQASSPPRTPARASCPPAPAAGLLPATARPAPPARALRSYRPGDRPPAPRRNFQAHWAYACEGQWRIAFLCFSLGIPVFFVNMALAAWIKVRGRRARAPATPGAVPGQTDAWRRLMGIRSVGTGQVRWDRRAHIRRAAMRCPGQRSSRVCAPGASCPRSPCSLLPQFDYSTKTAVSMTGKPAPGKGSKRCSHSAHPTRSSLPCLHHPASSAALKPPMVTGCCYPSLLGLVSPQAHPPVLFALQSSWALRLPSTWWPRIAGAGIWWGAAAAS